MNVDSNEVATDLYIFLERKNKRNFKAEPVLPEPLAKVKNELLVKDSSAVSYEVKKGDFIQIVDLYGRQCSDFNAFDSNALQSGKNIP